MEWYVSVELELGVVLFWHDMQHYHRYHGRLGCLGYGATARALGGGRLPEATEGLDPVLKG